VRQRRYDLYRVHRLRQFRQHRRLVAGTAADFQHCLAGLEIQQFGHRRDDIGLGDGLAVADGQRPVFVGVGLLVGRHELVARHPVHHRQHAGVDADGIAEPGHRGDFLDHLLALPGFVAHDGLMQQAQQHSDPPAVPGRCEVTGKGRWLHRYRSVENGVAPLIVVRFLRAVRTNGGGL